MDDKDFISVVTPFHNTVDYLEECITSVLRQTYTNFEYLLCDNASSDGSTEIAEFFAARDPRIRLLRFDELVPQVENYNRALGHISPRGGWCKIVQADDWLYERCLERMIQVGNLDDDIGLVGAYYLMGTGVFGCGLPIDCQVFAGREACRRQLRDGIFFMGSPSSVMYRSQIVRNRRPFYSPNRYHEDTEAAYEILEHHKLGFVHEQLSFLRVGNPSKLTSVADCNFQILDKLIILERYAHRFLPAVEAQALKRTAKRHYFMFLGARLFQKQWKEFWSYHREGLATLGWHWSWRPIVGGAALVALKAVGNPLSTLQQIWHWYRRRRDRRA